MGSLAADTRWMDAVDQAALVRRGEVSAAELLDAAIERIESIDPALNAVIIRWFDEARRAATQLPDGPFRGVPFLLKDLWAHYAGQPLTNGCRALKNALPISPADTTLVARFRQAGLNIAGRTNSPEFGSLPTTEPMAWGPTRNPWNLEHSPGGSSGGSAAAVAAGMVPFAHASDGGGSIRIPASCCGLVGLKPSQGRITLGPFRDESNLGVELCVSRTVRDTARLLDAVRGPGVGDTVIAPAPERPYVDELGADPGRLANRPARRPPIGWRTCTTSAATLFAVQPRCSNRSVITSSTAFPPALANRDFGRRFSALWSTNMGVAVQRIEAQLGRPMTDDDVEPVNRAQVDFARNVNAVDYALALAANAEFRRAVQQWWADGWDLLLTPTLAEPPGRIGTFANDLARPMAPMARAAAYVPVHPAVQLQRAAGDQPPAALEQLRLADRRATRRRVRPRGRLAESGITARGGPALGASASGLVTFGPVRSVPVV